MKIMYLLFSFTVGGTEKLVTDICNEMHRQGNEVFLYIVNQHYSKDMLRGLNNGVVVELQNRVPGQENIVKTMRKIEQYVRKNNIDIIHCNSFDSPELLFWTKLLHPTIKIVYTIHDVNQWCSLNRIRSIYRNLICSRIIAISKSVAQDIVSSGAKAKKVSIVYNAIDLDKFKEMDNGKDENTPQFFIGNVARIMPEKKGQDILVKAVAKVRKRYPYVRCIFAGQADEAHQKDFNNLKKMAAELGEHIEFVGNVTDVPKLLQGLDLFILPSRFEGFGISLIEAMAMGVPCIASSLDGPAEIIGNEERGLLFPTEDVDALAEKIIFAIEHDVEMREIATKAEQYVNLHFDIRKMCKQLIQQY